MKTIQKLHRLTQISRRDCGPQSGFDLHHRAVGRFGAGMTRVRQTGKLPPAMGIDASS